MSYRRYWNRYKIKIISILIIISIIYILRLSGENLKPEVPEIINGFDEVEIKYELTKYNDIKNEYQLTGIILHWRRLNGVRELVKTMLRYEDLFPHIIIWNNNPKKVLTFADLLIEKNDRIEIINSEQNIKDQAKYRSCQLAKTNACFYVDDDWDIKLYVRSLYESFLLEPTILHAITDQFTYFTNLMWTFFDKDIDLHTGFSWIGCGSVFSRDNAVRHLKYISYFLETEKNRGKIVHDLINALFRLLDLLPQADQFFAIWMNQFPAQFNGRMLHSTEGASSSFENFDFDTIQHRASVLSIEVLESTLRTSPNSPLFERRRAPNPFVTYTKSPCSYNDRFIFYTNCFPIMNLEQIPFNITTDIQRGTRRNLPNTRRSRYHEDLKFFERYSTANAVDNDTNTCWKSNHPVLYGDLYGMDFNGIQISRDLSFSIEYLHESSLQENLEISISLNTMKWISIPRPYSNGIIHDKQNKLVTIHTRLLPDEYQVFRAIKFTAVNDEIDSFHVCEVKLLN